MLLFYDRNATNVTYDIGNNVLLSNEASKPNLSKKLTPKYTGPYEVIKRNSPTNITIRIKNKNHDVHVNRIKPYQNSHVADASCDCHI
jgi:cytochrome b involved in lipid metabolism